MFKYLIFRNLKTMVKKQIKHTIFYKYSVILKWPLNARNRSADTLKERPDIVQDMNHFRQKIENVCKLILKRNYEIDDVHHMSGVRIQFESGQDLYEFVIRQPEFDWEIVPEVGTINRLNGEYKKFTVEYQPSGISIT